MSQSEIQTLYEASTIQQKVEALGEQIENDHPNEDLVLISILGGSVVFLADLIRAIRRPVRYEAVRVHYGPSLDEEILEIQYPISLDVAGQTVIVVKDVIATGVIDNYLISQFADRGARTVEFAALLDLPEERRVDIRPAYSLFTPKRAGTFVGYGLKYEGQYGNLPYLGRIVQP